MTCNQEVKQLNGGLKETLDNLELKERLGKAAEWLDEGFEKLVELDKERRKKRNE